LHQSAWSLASFLVLSCVFDISNTTQKNICGADVKKYIGVLVMLYTQTVTFQMQ